MPVAYSSKNGFSIAEVVVALGIFLILAVGTYSGITAIFQVVRNSQIRIIELGLANEQFEYIHNMDYHDVGIVNGSPSGVLERTITSTYNGQTFLITRTIRNVDDPFDGTIDGDPINENQTMICHQGTNTIVVGNPSVPAHQGHGDTLGPCSGDPAPQDTLAADYKLVQIEVLCPSCGQTHPLLMNGRISPKFIEGDPNNGALFIHVFDANAQPVVGADIHVVATSTSSTYDFVDVTDNEGYLRLVDMSPGLQAYHLTATKSGYTIDRTITSSPSNPNPVKPPASVFSQSVTDMSFSIDLASTLSLTTEDSLCHAIPAADLHIVGTKQIGTSPHVYKVDRQVTTDGSGQATLPDLDWDQYALTPIGYDLYGTIPDFPLTLLPGAVQNAQILLTPDVGNSLLINIRDASSGAPVANATVDLTDSPTYSSSIVTGVGSWRQTDWSGGSGQSVYVDTTQYDMDDGNVDVVSSIGNVSLRQVAGVYTAQGSLESSVIDFGGAVEYLNLSWQPLGQLAETGSTSVQFQIASSPTQSTSTWDFLGPDGTNATYYTATTPEIHPIHDGDQYVKYKLYLSTASTTYTPTISDVLITYTNSCTPPGQAYFGPLSNATYVVSVSATGYDTYTGTINVNADQQYTVDLVPTP